MAKTFEALKHRNYQLWFAGQMVSLMGTWMQSTAQGFLVYQLTGSSAYLGYVALASGIPPWLFTLYAGAMVDRIPCRKVLIVTQIAMMLTACGLVALTASGKVQPWHILALSVLLGVANAFDAPARQSFVVELVPKKDLSNAIALNSTMFNAASVTGPAVAGVIYAAIGPVWCFSLNAASFLAVIVALLFMKLPAKAKHEHHGSVWSGVRAGLKYVRGHPEIRTVLLNIMAISTFGSAFVTLIPAWSVEVLRGDALTAGLLQSARGIGSMTASIGLATLGYAALAWRNLRISSLALPVVLMVFAWVHAKLPSMVLIAIAGTLLMITINLSNMLIQDRVSDKMRGRVMGIYNLAIFGMLPIGSFIVGVAADRYGVPWSLFGSSVALLIVSSSLLRKTFTHTP